MTCSHLPYINEFSPDGLEYDRQLKGYKPTANFRPQFSQGTVNEYLHLLHQDKAQTSMLSLMDLRYGHTEVLDASEHGREHDSKWNTHVDVVIIPNPCLTPGQQDIIAQDYAMQDGQLRFTRRLPLVHYALDRMQVSYDGQHEAKPLLYPLVLANRQQLIEQGCEFKLAT